MNKERRMYSLNLAAYVMMVTELTPTVGVEKNDQGTLCYLVFPECAAVAMAINQYKKHKELHKFLNAYAELRNMLNEARE